MTELLTAVVNLLSKLLDKFSKKSVGKSKSVQTSELIDEDGIDEEAGELTMIADKMLERLRKKNRTKK